MKAHVNGVHAIVDLLRGSVGDVRQGCKVVKDLAPPVLLVRVQVRVELCRAVRMRVAYIASNLNREAKKSMIRAVGTGPVHQNSREHAFDGGCQIDPSQVDGAVARACFASMGNHN